MSWLARWVLGLYPATWRARYGEEMEALLGDSGVGPFIVADLLMGAIRMRLTEWSFAKLAVALSLAGAICGAGVVWLTAPRLYYSEATLRFNAGSPDENIIEIDRTKAEVLSRASLSAIINDSALQLYLDQLEVRPLEDVIEGMKHDITLRQTGSGIFAVSFVYPDREKVQKVAAVLAQKLVAQSVHPESGSTGGWADVLDSASLPWKPSYPNTVLIQVCGFLAGVALAFLWRALGAPVFIARRFVSVALIMGLCGFAAIDFTRVQSMGESGHGIFGERYVSTASMVVPGERVAGLIEKVKGDQSLATIITDPHLNLYSGAEPATIAKMRRDLVIEGSSQSGPTVLTLRFTYPDRVKAQQTLWSVMNAVDIANKRSLAGIAAAGARTVPLEMTAEASEGADYQHPDLKPGAQEGGALGFLLAVMIGLGREVWNFARRSMGSGGDNPVVPQ